MLKSVESLPNAVTAGVDQDYQNQHCRHIMFSPDFLIVHATSGRLWWLRFDENSFFPQIVVEDTVEDQNCSEWKETQENGNYWRYLKHNFLHLTIILRKDFFLYFILLIWFLKTYPGVDWTHSELGWCNSEPLPGNHWQVLRNILSSGNGELIRDFLKYF